MAMEDPLQSVEEEMKLLREKMAEVKKIRDKILEKRKKWPKLIKVSVSQGKWSEAVVEAFAQIGWLTKEDGSLGPCDNGKYIAAQAWLYYEVSEAGVVRLVGVEDQDFGKAGVWPIDPEVCNHAG